jgi:hypothetical protein
LIETCQRGRRRVLTKSPPLTARRLVNMAGFLRKL